MKKIALAAAAMGGTALIAFGASGTFAAFSDTAQLSGSTAGAGSLTVSASQAAVAKTEAVNLAPGKSVDMAYWVANDATSDSAGFISGVVTDLVDLENTCNGPETAPGPNKDTTCADNQGEFSSVATVTGSNPLVGKADCTVTAFNESRSYDLGTLKALAAGTGWAYPESVESGKGVCFVLRVALPESATNAVQTDSATFGVTFTLKQDVTTAVPVRR